MPTPRYGLVRLRSHAEQLSTGEALSPPASTTVWAGHKHSFGYSFGSTVSPLLLHCKGSLAVPHLRRSRNAHCATCHCL